MESKFRTKAIVTVLSIFVGSGITLCLVGGPTGAGKEDTQATREGDPRDLVTDAVPRKVQGDSYSDSFPYCPSPGFFRTNSEERKLLEEVLIRTGVNNAPDSRRDQANPVVRGPGHPSTISDQALWPNLPFLDQEFDYTKNDVPNLPVYSDGIADLAGADENKS